MFRHGEPRDRHRASADPAVDHLESSDAASVAQARRLAEAFQERILTNTPLEHQGDRLSWWYRATRDGPSNIAQYVDDTVLVNVDGETIAILQQLATLTEQHLM